MTNHEIPAEDLALYALGALTSEEQERIAAHLETCASCRTELMKLRGDAALLALSAPPVAAPARARQHLFDEIAKTPAAKKSAVKLGAPWWQVAFPTLTALALIVFAFYLITQNALVRHELDNARFAAAQQSATIEQARQVVETLSATNAQRVTLVATQSKPQPQAQTIYQRDKGRLVLVASNLEALPQNKTYELWILPANGSAPIPAGTFQPDAGGNASLVLPQIPTGVEAKGFAVTIEPLGGSATPTMPIKMLGTTS
jgi:anti-sigma-K factor RskA